VLQIRKKWPLQVRKCNPHKIAHISEVWDQRPLQSGVAQPKLREIILGQLQRVQLPSGKLWPLDFGELEREREEDGWQADVWQTKLRLGPSDVLPARQSLPATLLVWHGVEDGGDAE